MNLNEINEAIKLLPEDQKELVSDWYHTFKELYEHRVTLFVSLCNHMERIWEMSDSYKPIAWKSKLHSDGTMYDWWFIAGIWESKWKTLTYHLPISEWDKMDIREIPKAPEWDWHTSDDVIRLLKQL